MELPDEPTQVLTPQRLEAIADRFKRALDTPGDEFMVAWAVDHGDELIVSLRLARQRECPGLEEHDALQHMTTRALRAEEEVERLHEEDSLRTKEHNILVRENRLLRAAAEGVLRDVQKVTQLMWTVHDVTVTELRTALDTSAAVRITDE